MRCFQVVLFFVFFASNAVEAQKLTEATTRQVYSNLVDAIGNNHPRSPILKFKKSSRNPASYNPDRKTITIEYKVLEICASFGEDSLNALSYILAHELGHHYRNHGWMSHYSSLDFSEIIDNQNANSELRQLYEEEADIYAGFYSHIAGYNALNVADALLDSIYKSYSLPDEIKNYPSLDQRKSIISKNKNDFHELRNIFDLANLLMSVGHYDYAQELYNYIVKKGFTSRELFNNLGLCYIYEALSLNVEDVYFNALLPFKIDFTSRLESHQKTRSLTTMEKAIWLFTEAKREFKTALELDGKYSLAKENLFFTQVALNYLGEHIQPSFNIIDDMSSNLFCSFCVEGHLSAINKKPKKALRFFKKGSNSCEICDVNTDFKKRQTPKIKTLTKNKFDTEIINDIDMYCLDFRSTNCDNYYKLEQTKICESTLESYRVYMLRKRQGGESSCISIQQIIKNDDQFKNNIGVYIGDHVDKILDDFENLRIINSNYRKYISVIDEHLTFLIVDDYVQEWFYNVEY